MNAITRGRLARQANAGLILLALAAVFVFGIAGSVLAAVPTKPNAGQTHGDGQCPGGKGKDDPSSGLDQCQRRAIEHEIRRCYEQDTSQEDFATYSAMIIVSMDAGGVVRSVTLSQADQARANSNPAFRAFAERAEHAVQDPLCAHLPLPPNLLGQPASQLTFRFRP